MNQTLYCGKSNNCCAYCNLHKCHMTVKQMKKKECLKKQCWHLKKNPDHQFWHQRDTVKSKKKARKEMLNAYVAQFALPANSAIKA